MGDSRLAATMRPLPAALVLAALGGAVAAEEPFQVGPGSRVCTGNSGGASSSSNDPEKSAAVFVDSAKITKAGAYGRLFTEHSATAEVGITFRPLLDFDATLTVFPRYNGILTGGGPSVTNKANFSLHFILRDVTAGSELDPVEVDAVEETSGSTGVVQDLFDPPAGAIAASLRHDHDYEAVIRLRVSAQGVNTVADFFKGLRGADYDCIEFASSLADGDGDGLYDVWETSGIDVDGDGDGEVDLANDDLGVDYRGMPIALDPGRKDLLVEIDYFDCAVAGADCAAGNQHSHQPVDEALDRVREAFAQAPVANPDGQGVRTWFVRDQGLAHRESCDFNCLDEIKPANFGAGDAADPKRLAARRLIFHYSLWVHRAGAPDDPATILGLGELPGNDTLISLGGWTDDTGTPQQQALTFLHEVGHNLGLDHGGGDGRNCKPNYLSVMSYLWAGTGLVTDPGELDGRLDYSTAALPGGGTLDEQSLDETIGIEDGELITFFGPPADLDGINQGGAVTPLEDDWHLGQGSGPIDWDQDGAIETAEPTDINDLGIAGCPPDPGEKLHGHDDWGNLVFNFRAGDNFIAGQHSAPEETFDFDTAQRVRERVWWSGLDHLHEYSGKLVCGVQAEEQRRDLARGGYATTTNVHNPNSRRVTFRHKLALAMPESSAVAQRIYPLGFRELEPDEAVAIDCDDVAAALFPDGLPGGLIDGFLVVQSPRSLDVAGVYTTTALDEADRLSGHSSIDVERIAERISGIDLSVEKSARSFSVPIGDRLQWHFVLHSITVGNAGPRRPARCAPWTRSPSRPRTRWPC